MSSPGGSLRKRGGKKEVVQPLPSQAAHKPVPSSRTLGKPPSEWDYYVGLVVMTALAFATRFWMITYPQEVVFDEVHFGKVRVAP
jgi:dolichyl-phosphate-mannose-protein mannosyltransferase